MAIRRALELPPQLTPALVGDGRGQVVVARHGRHRQVLDHHHAALSGEAGGEGFLLKDTPPQKIVEAVHRVIAGEPALSPSVTAQLIAAATEGQSTERRDDALAALASLTERERDVAVAIGQGLSNAEIGAQLYMSVATVKSHVTRLFAKLQVENRVQIAMCVHDAGLV